MRCQTIVLHVGWAGGFFCSQCGLVLELLVVVSFTISRVNPSNPLKTTSLTLLHPLHIVFIEFVSRCLAEDLHWGPRPRQLISRLLRLDLWVNTCGGKESDYHCYLNAWSNLKSATVSPLPVVVTTRKRIVQHQPMVRSGVLSDCREDSDLILLWSSEHSCIYHQILTGFAYSWAGNILDKDLLLLEKIGVGDTWVKYQNAEVRIIILFEEIHPILLPWALCRGYRCNIIYKALIRFKQLPYLWQE